MTVSDWEAEGGFVPYQETDEDKFVALMNHLGVRINDVWESDYRRQHIIYGGYDGFYQTWSFDHTGKFIETGAWE
jgi:hypothetical protein